MDGMGRQTVRYRYRIYPTRGQEWAANRLFGCCRVLYNDVIDLFRSRFDPSDREAMPSQSQAQSMLIAQAKKTPERAWLSEASNVALIQMFRDAWQSCWNGVRKDRRQRFARYRSKKRNPVNSARFTRNGFAVRPNGVYLAKIGIVKTKWSRRLPSTPSSCTLIHEPNGRWYVSFVVERGTTPLPENGVFAGIDMGLSDMAAVVTTDGRRWRIGNPRNYTLLQKRIARLQKHLAGQEKGSRRYARTRKRIAILYAKAHDTLDDYQNKNVLHIVRETQTVGVEALNVHGIAVSHGRSARDAAIRSFLNKLEWKSGQYGRTVKHIGRWEPSTRLCSQCKHYVDGGIPEHVRVWQCADCGTILDRDWNAALNILDAAGLAESLNARGGSVRPDLASAGNGGTHGSANPSERRNIPSRRGIPVL